ncbi:hypothetical protein DPX16_19181 [Anabarilius grahami]|uniref:Uncharacterized protein n=1 Tax=Anabarilius grahami TaxID=495550 RepID=A0A3N0Z062_ANAGA|nr:hypothetical protein DPX16_19181 [Anabarilius grahami]
MPHQLCLSFAPPATLVENAGKVELRQGSWVPADDVIPSRSRKFVESRTGTEKQRRQPPNHYQGPGRERGGTPAPPQMRVAGPAVRNGEACVTPPTG